MERAERSGGPQAKRGRWGSGLRARGAELSLETLAAPFTVAFKHIRTDVAGYTLFLAEPSPLYS